MLEEVKYQKSKKSLRKLKKRQEVFVKKRLLLTPKNISYTVDESGDFIIVSGEVEKEPRINDLAHYIRFKLSGQQDFTPFGYQAKIPIQNYRFQFEVLQDALLELDYIEIQLFNKRNQSSECAVCYYEKVQLIKEVKMYEEVNTPVKTLSRLEKYQMKKQ